MKHPTILIALLDRWLQLDGLDYLWISFGFLLGFLAGFPGKPLATEYYFLGWISWDYSYCDVTRRKRRRNINQFSIITGAVQSDR